jgi:hypothetical protein
MRLDDAQCRPRKPPAHYRSYHIDVTEHGSPAIAAGVHEPQREGSKVARRSPRYLANARAGLNGDNKGGPRHNLDFDVGAPPDHNPVAVVLIILKGKLGAPPKKTIQVARFIGPQVPLPNRPFKSSPLSLRNR